ncbi:S-protein homolog 2-like [Raphanus sativus]|uniref:S-protein homolog n=1 Tax=Raphanus sativus TaxID=3726 RepID=A0A9W3CQR7_RAPSA|nr:S-protein homolog 2-like [Raphanus sativus]
MVIPKRYPSLLTLIILIATDLSHAETINNIHVVNGSSLSSTKDEFIPMEKITVEIINDIGGTVTLHYHCKSKDDDLGDRSLQPGGSWSFSFKPQIFGRSLFFCSFALPNGMYYFDIYRYHRESSGDDWCQQCMWKIRQTGPCRFNRRTKKFDICFPWNKNKSLY